MITVFPDNTPWCIHHKYLLGLLCFLALDADPHITFYSQNNVFLFKSFNIRKCQVGIAAKNKNISYPFKTLVTKILPLYQSQIYIG